MIEFGRRLREVRLEVGVSQEKLAELSKIHRTYVSKIERGQCNVSLIYVQSLAAALGVTMGELMPDTKRSKSKAR